MLVQIVRRKSVSWLLTANAISLALVLYGCCFLNAPWLVAHYNVEHSREVIGRGPYLDLEYLASLHSAEVLPPIEARLSEIPQMQSSDASYCCLLPYRIKTLRNLVRPENWRAWGFRTWRLERYFANTAPERLNPSNGGKDQGYRDTFHSGR